MLNIPTFVIHKFGNPTHPTGQPLTAYTTDTMPLAVRLAFRQACQPTRGLVRQAQAVACMPLAVRQAHEHHVSTPLAVRQAHEHHDCPWRFAKSHEHHDCPWRFAWRFAKHANSHVGWFAKPTSTTYGSNDGATSATALVRSFPPLGRCACPWLCPR